MKLIYWQANRESYNATSYKSSQKARTMHIRKSTDAFDELFWFGWIDGLCFQNSYDLRGELWLEPFLAVNCRHDNF